MSSNLNFTESQKFTQIWIWALLIVLFVGLPVYAYVQKDNFSFIPLLIGIPFMIFMYILRLDTTIDSDGIKIRFFPFLKRSYLWKDVEKAEVRKYNSLLEYGGWGIRIGFNGTAYNIKGNQGLQLHLKNGNKVLIGTQKSEEIQTHILGYLAHN